MTERDKQKTIFSFSSGEDQSVMVIKNPIYNYLRTKLIITLQVETFRFVRVITILYLLNVRYIISIRPTTIMNFVLF